MKLKLILGLTLAASALAAAAITVDAAPGAPMRAPTYMFVGSKRVGSVVAAPGTAAWTVLDCPNYALGWGNDNRSHSRINLHYATSGLAGYARKKTPTIWLVFKPTSAGASTLVATAMRRSSTRWDVFRRNGRPYGHTQGPDGPEAAATLVLLCGIGLARSDLLDL